MIDEAAVQAKPEYALNKWLEGPLTRYLKRDFATEADPIRKLLEGDRPVSHMNLDDLFNTAQEGWISQEALRNREKAGLPRSGVGQSGYGQAWETLSDAFTRSNPASEVFRDYSRFDPEHPMSQEWVSKLPGDTPIYDFIGDEAPDWLGLPHLRDELWNAVREDSDLPNALKLRPEDFQQMGIEKAIRHVANINDWRAQQQAAANIEMLNGPGVKLIREYPENNPKGLRWVELAPGEEETAAEALAKQLKYEGDTMGHCVGGYCDDVLEGSTKIFSLRDAKGEPHVTIEVAPGEQPAIVQVKGKQNRAPKEDYLPFVQDFLKKPYHGGEWDPDIGDLDYTGLITTTEGLYTPDEAYQLLTSPEHKHLQKDLMQQLEFMQGNPKYPEYDRLLNGQGYADGGLVGKQDFNGVVGYILE